AVNDVILMRSPDRLLAVNFLNGKRIWEFPWFDLSEEEIILESPVQRGEGANENRSRQLRQRLWEDAAFGQISSDGKKVFVLWDMGYANSSANAQMMMMVGPAGIAQRQRGQSKPFNQLAALDLETEGSLLWVVCGESGEDESRLAGAFFLGAPLPLYGQLYCLAEFNGEIRLVVLDARTGQLQWSQQLAHVESRTILVDRLRRLSGASPSFSDGILICPTAAGAVVAVDISSHSLLWGYQYPLNNTSRRSAIRRPIPIGGAPTNNQGWIDGTVTISADTVLLTPVEGSQLLCLDLLTGIPRWEPHPRGTGLFVACIHNQSAVLVNQDSLTAVSLSDGDPAWAKPLGLDGERPSGRGFYSHGHYYLPTTGSRLLKIDAGSGELLESIRTEHPLGNLVCYKDQVLSQTPGALQSFFQLDLLRKDVKEKLSKNPDDPWALARKCELLLQDGDRATAMKTLRRCLENTPEDVGLRALMVKTSLELLRDDFLGNRALLAEMEKLIDHPAQRQDYLELLAAGLQENGETLAAFDTYMVLIGAITLPVDLEVDTRQQLQPVETDLHVRRDRWIQVKLESLRATASEDQRKHIDSVILDRYAKAVESGRPRSLREYLAYFGRHPSGSMARMQLASRLIESNQAIERELLEAELLLTHIQQSPDTTMHGEALARMALLLQKAERWVEAGQAFQQLASRFGETVVLEADTGRELLEEASRDERLAQYLVPPPWKAGKVHGPSQINNKGQFPPFQRIYQMPLVELQGTLPSSTMVALDQTRNSLVIRDQYGTTLQRVSMNDGRRPVSSSQYSISYARAAGHLMLLSLGPEIVAVDTIRNSQDPSE
ncbi:MAG: PQQ-binding-like beta-propeller repeat protein, partial [Pirellulaceae bacterium]